VCGQSKAPARFTWVIESYGVYSVRNTSSRQES